MKKRLIIFSLLTCISFSLCQAKDLGDKLNNLKKSLTELRTKLVNLSKEIQLLKDKLDGTDVLHAFLERYGPPDDLKKLLDANKDNPNFHCDFGPIYQVISMSPYETKEFFKDKYFAKGWSQPNRLFNLEKLKQCIETNKLNLIGIPRKWIYKKKNHDLAHYEKPHFKNDECLYVFADNIPHTTADNTDGIPWKKITLEEVKQLSTLIEETGYNDWNSGNLVRRISDGMLLIPDTDNRSFDKARGKIESLKLLIGDPYGIFQNHMEADALAWLKQHINNLEKEVASDPSKDEIPYLKEDETGHIIVNPDQYTDPLFKSIANMLPKY